MTSKKLDNFNEKLCDILSTTTAAMVLARNEQDITVACAEAKEKFKVINEIYFTFSEKEQARLQSSLNAIVNLLSMAVHLDITEEVQ